MDRPDKPSDDSLRQLLLSHVIPALSRDLPQASV